jgi:perosamine synthetase
MNQEKQAVYEPGAPTPEGFIPLCVPQIQGSAWDYVKECLDTNWVSSVGPFVDRFEREVAAYTDTQYAIATVTGTAALHIALLVAGVQPNDEVLVSTLTFIAPANAIRYCGAWPVLIDAEPDTWEMDPQKVADFLEGGCIWENGELRNKVTGRRVKAILPVHILGHPVNIDSILDLAQKFGLPVIEDATEALGAHYKDRKAGSLGDIACFSFNGNKIITTGGGGMIVTNNETLARRARYLTTQAKDDPLEYIHNEIGYNYRLTNMQAALGCSQLEQLDEYIQVKRRIAQAYSEHFAQVPGITPMREAEWASSIFWMYTVLVDETEYGMDSRQLLRCLQEAGIQSRPLWQPVHLSPSHAGNGYRCEVAEHLYQHALSLPCSVGLTEAGQGKVIEQVTALHASVR